MSDEADTPNFKRKSKNFPSFAPACNFEVEIFLFFPGVSIEDQFFHHVVMSLSLQTVRHTLMLLDEMLRVGREAVVSFPNFGHKPNREALMQGRMPVSEALPYEWYDSPNVRFFTIADFEVLCRENHIEVIEAVFFDAGARVTEDPNLNASLAVYRLGRAGAVAS